MNDKELREKVRVMKALGYIKNYYEVAQRIQISEKGFYNWLRGDYQLGYKKKQQLVEVLKGAAV